MTLSCSCDNDFDPSDYSWYWMEHSKVKHMPDLPRRKRCCSCGELINPGEDVFEFRRYRVARNQIEARIHGDEVPLSSSWTCEICSGLITSVEHLGMCYSLNEPIKSQIAEYREAERKHQEYLKNNPEQDYLGVEDFIE